MLQAFQPTIPVTNIFRTRRYLPRSPVCALPQSAYTTLPDSTPLCRFMTDTWQIGGAPGTLDASSVTRAIDTLVDAGFTTFHLPHVAAQSYASAYQKLVGRAMSKDVHFCTKLVLDAHALDSVCRRSVQDCVDSALMRMSCERIHLLQLQWSDHSDERFVDVLGHLQDIKVDGKIRSVGTVNFPTKQLRYLHSQKITISSNQVSFSLVDRRPVVEMTDWCAEKGVGLLAYSTLGGGFIREKYLGLPEPTRRACSTASLLRFANLIRVWGGWSLFQELLYAVKLIADKYDVSMANVAVNWVLRQPSLSAVIVGARLGMASESDHTRSNMRTFDFSLDEDDISMLDNIAMKGNDLYALLGDSGNEYQSAK